jgi:hypothetical protein
MKKEGERNKDVEYFFQFLKLIFNEHIIWII